MKKSNREKRIEWMAIWCAKNGLQLQLKGKCGFGRECVGVTVEGKYPDYEWHDRKTYEKIDNNGEVWTPENAYHKHTCVAVLGRGEEAEKQLYDWLKWFDKNGFELEVGDNKSDEGFDEIDIIFGNHRYARMVRKN